MEIDRSLRLCALRENNIINEEVSDNYMCPDSIIAFSQTSTEWNIFRGDQSLSGYSHTKIKFPMDLSWTFQTEDAIVAAPVIGDNSIFVSSIDGLVYALDFSGKMIWNFEADNSIEAPALFLNGRVYVGDFSGYLYCLDAKSGKLIWTYETENQIMGSPNYVYLKNQLHILVGSYDYFLHCVMPLRAKTCGNMSLTILSMAPHASATTWPCLAVVMDICIWWIWSQAKQITSLK
jgi:hypothetical protein